MKTRYRQLGKQLIDEPESIQSVKDEDLVGVSKYIKPYGVNFTGEEEIASLSILNLREDYMKKLLTTSIIGYLFKVAADFEPEYELEQMDKDMAKELTHATNNSEYKQIVRNYEERKKELTINCRNVVSRFLRTQFKFDPNHHVESAREGLNTAEDITSTNNDNVDINKIYETKQDDIVELLKQYTNKSYQIISETTTQIESLIKMVRTLKLADLEGLLCKKYSTILKIKNELARLSKPLTRENIREVIKSDVPRDVFVNVTRYIENNYEELRNVSEELYGIKNDLEFAVIYYGSHKTQTSAEAWQEVHATDLSFPVITVSNKNINLLGPFKENTERTQFYSKNTEVLRKMLDQQERDFKLGEDLIKKRVYKEKAKLVRKDGIPDKELMEVNKTMAGIKGDSMPHLLNEDDYKRMVTETIEPPHDAIEMDVFYTEKGADGQRKMKTKKIYTQSEIPLHLQEGSQYVDKYQSPQSGGITKKKITSHTGKTIEILDTLDEKK